MPRLSVIGFILLVGGCAGNLVSDGRVQVSHFGQSDNLIKTVLQRTNRAIDKINKYWGAEFDGTIRVNIEDREIRSSADYANRFINLSKAAIESARPVIEHEVAHIVVGRDAGNRRFLNEGMAMYLEEKFRPSTPMRGNQLDRNAKRAMNRTGFISLQDTNEFFLDRAENLRAQRFTVYREAGSFVKYLIEVHGLDKFKEVFRGFSFDSVYDSGIDELQSKWLDKNFSHLGGRKIRGK
ncbi:MAG: hypothetical protein HQ503_04795 [Rhodospirillales bacterium]|nr:hypothetical protein [Rhodospirillales bacterium]